jgi:hypothetical protein
MEGGAGKRKVSPANGALEDKFNSREHYMSLSDDQKEALRQMRLAHGRGRGRVPNVKKGKTVNNGAKSNKAVIAALTDRLDALVTAKGNEVQVNTEGTGNLNNNSLRQRSSGPGELNLSTLICSLGSLGQT